MLIPHVDSLTSSYVFYFYFFCHLLDNRQSEPVCCHILPVCFTSEFYAQAFFRLKRSHKWTPQGCWSIVVGSRGHQFPRAALKDINCELVWKTFQRDAIFMHHIIKWFISQKYTGFLIFMAPLTTTNYIQKKKITEYMLHHDCRYIAK